MFPCSRLAALAIRPFPPRSSSMTPRLLLLLLALSALTQGNDTPQKKKKKRQSGRCEAFLLTGLTATGTPNLVSLYVDSWSFNVTGFEASCNVSTSQGLLFSDWQQTLQSSDFGPVGPAGGVMYVESNAAAPGNLVVGLADAASLTFYGFLHTGAPDLLGAAVWGRVEDVTLPAPPSGKRIAGSGGSGNATVTLRRLSPVAIAAGGAAMPAALRPPSGGVYGSPSPSLGQCLAGATCTVSSRWEVRLVLDAAGGVAVWAWAQGYQQFYHVFPGPVPNLRDAPLALHVFNMNAGTPAAPLYPLLSGLDMRFKQEASFSRVASRIYSAPDIRALLPAASLFAAPAQSVFPLAQAIPGAPCPALNFVAPGPAPAGYTPLLVWSLGAMGVQLNASLSYTVSLSAFVNNLTSLNSSVLVSLYDGATALGAVTLPPAAGLWADALAAPTPLAASAALNFPLGAPPLAAQHNPAPELLAAAAYSSRRVSLELRLWRPNGTAAFSLFGSDPEAPLAQAGGRARLRALSAAYPLTPAVSSADPALNAFAAGASDLRVVLWAAGPQTRAGRDGPGRRRRRSRGGLRWGRRGRRLRPAQGARRLRRVRRRQRHLLQRHRLLPRLQRCPRRLLELVAAAGGGARPRELSDGPAHQPLGPVPAAGPRPAGQPCLLLTLPVDQQLSRHPDPRLRQQRLGTSVPLPVPAAGAKPLHPARHPGHATLTQMNTGHTCALGLLDSRVLESLRDLQKNRARKGGACEMDKPHFAAAEGLHAELVALSAVGVNCELPCLFFFF